MSIHNRTRAAALLATALTVALAGFGCEPQRTPSVGDLPAAGDTGGITRWTSYTSPTLGITIPYPEGWVAQEQEDGSVDFFESTPPASGDAPSRMWALKRASDSVDAAIQAEFPTVYDRNDVTRSGIVMTRIVYPYDARLDPDKRMVAYVWLDGDVVRMMGGAENDVGIEYSIDHLEVTP